MTQGNGYVSNATTLEVAARLKAARRAVVTTHQKPDGDAIGSALAVVLALQASGVDAQLWLIGPVGDAFLSVLGSTAHVIASPVRQPPEDVDTIVITDTGARSQLSELEHYLQGKAERIVILDHHIQGDPALAHLRIVRPQASAACEVVADVVASMGVALTAPLATALYLGVATDTGWFRFSNSSPSAFRTAARMLEAGADHPALYRLIEQTDRPERLRLLARALGSMELLADGKVAVLSLTLADFAQTGAEADDTHGFSDAPHCVGSVEVVALLSETQNGMIKISLRSKQSARPVDVNAIAGRFGGGGHARASGAKMKGSLPEVKAAVISAINSATGF